MIGRGSLTGGTHAKFRDGVGGMGTGWGRMVLTTCPVDRVVTVGVGLVGLPGPERRRPPRGTARRSSGRVVHVGFGLVGLPGPTRNGMLDQLLNRDREADEVPR